MTKFLLKCLLFVLCLAALAFIFFFVISPRFPFDMSRYVPRWEAKMARLNSRPEGKPLLVLVGGSNLYYGIEDELLYAALSNRFHAVNMGLHAGLGLGRMLEEVAPYLKRGDIVCLAPEYSHFVSDIYSGGTVALAFTIDYKQKPMDLFLSRRYASCPRLGWTGYVNTKIKNIIKRQDCGSGNPDLSEIPQAPTPAFVNERLKPPKPWQLNTEAFAWLKHFADDMSARGVRIVFSAPAYDARRFAQHTDEVSAIKERLEQLGFECISDAADYAFPLGLMCNTEYHLNAIGRTNRTERLLRDFRRAGIAP